MTSTLSKFTLGAVLVLAALSLAAADTSIRADDGAAPVCGNSVLEDGEECENYAGKETCCTNDCKLVPDESPCVLPGAACTGVGACSGGTCSDFKCAVCGDDVVDAGEDCEPPSSGCCDANCHAVDACMIECPECTKAWDPRYLPDGTACPTDVCAIDHRCSYTKGMICYPDDSCPGNCPDGCVEVGEEQPSNGCSGRCELPACDPVDPIECGSCPECVYEGEVVTDDCDAPCPVTCECDDTCPECVKSWAPINNACGIPCPNVNVCAYNERCSYTAGKICKLDESCALNCPECVVEGEEQPSNGCGGTCDAPVCPDCYPPCPACTKSWAPIEDGCGNACPTDVCGPAERCSYTKGKTCVDDVDCLAYCPLCVSEGEDQPTNKCGGRCEAPLCDTAAVDAV